jgi:hypothetical protein
MRLEQKLYNSSELKFYVNEKGLSQKEAVLIALGADKCSPKSIQEIKRLLIDAGQQKAKGWPLGSRLGSAEGMAIKTADGWELTETGRQHVQNLGAPIKSIAVAKVAFSLRKLAETKITNEATSSFVMEAIQCFEASYYRAAIVLSWVGAVSVLYDYVCANELSAFNAEAKKRFPKWKDATTPDDLARLKEYDFLQIASAISLFGKSTKTELEQRLQLRNGCGHPNSMAIGENVAASHIEVLVMNVFNKF